MTLPNQTIQFVNKGVEKISKGILEGLSASTFNDVSIIAFAGKLGFV